MFTDNLSCVNLRFDVAVVRDITKNLLSIFASKSRIDFILAVPGQNSLGDISGRRVELDNLPLLQASRRVLPGLLNHLHVFVEIVVHVKVLRALWVEKSLDDGHFEVG